MFTDASESHEHQGAILPICPFRTLTEFVFSFCSMTLWLKSVNPAARDLIRAVWQFVATSRKYMTKLIERRLNRIRSV